MKKFKTGILLTLCMFVMPLAVNAAATDSYDVSAVTELTSDATYGSLRITDTTLTIKEGITLTIDGSEFITNTGSSDPESSLVLLNNGHIVMEEGSKLIITNTNASALAALYAQNDSSITLTGATLQVIENEVTGIDVESGLTITLEDLSTLEVTDNTGDGAYIVDGEIIANDSIIDISSNEGTGLRSKVTLNGSSTLTTTQNEFTGVILLDGSSVSDSSSILAYENNVGQAKIDADIRVLGTTTITDSGHIDASFVGPIKNFVDNTVSDGKIVVDGNEAILSFAYVVQLCEGVSDPDATCDADDLVGISTEIKNGVIVTTDDNNEIIAIIGGNINTTEALEIPKEITRVIIEDTVTKDLNIEVAENTKIENNSKAKVNVTLGEETIVVEAGKEVVIKASATSDDKKDNKKEELPPNTGDMNLYIMISVILMAIGLTGFVGKKMYAKLK